MPTSEKNILSIQALRGIAAVLVVFCHCEQYISAFLPTRLERYLGYCFGGFGVDIFFVISGFIMVYISQNNFAKQKAVSTFIIRRITRIFPIYWLTTLVALFVIIPSGLFAYAMPVKQQYVIEALRHSDYVLKSFLLIPSVVFASPIVAVAWTLLYEMFFYYAFSIMLFFNKKLYLNVLFVVFITLVLLNHYFANLHLTNSLSFYVTFYGNDIILEFIFGCFIAEQYLQGKMLTTNVAVPAVILSVLGLILSYHGNFISLESIRAIKWGIPSVFLVFGLLSLEYNGILKVPTFLIRLGDSSYSIYLTHLSIFLILYISFIKWIHQYISISGDLAILTAWPVCVLGGHLTFIYIERPLLKWCRKLSPKTISTFSHEKTDPLAAKN